MINSPVLVLNKFFFPIDTTNVKRAFLMLYGGAAKAVNLNYETFDFNTWSEISAANEEDSIKTVSAVIKIPRVIMVVRYDRVPSKEVRFNRYNIFKRDRLQCQYCGDTLPKSELTIDHVIPKALGGKTVWENGVCACSAKACEVNDGRLIPALANRCAPCVLVYDETEFVVTRNDCGHPVRFFFQSQLVVKVDRCRSRRCGRYGVVPDPFCFDSSV